MTEHDDQAEPMTERIPRMGPRGPFVPPQGPPPVPPQYPAYAPPPPPPPARKRTGRKVLAWTGAVLLALFVVAGVAGNRTSSSSAPASPAPPVAVDVPAAAPPQYPATFGEGTYVVGVDIAPGTYRTAGAEPGLFEYCAWFTKEGPSSNSDVIDFGTGNAGEPQVVEIDESVGAFDSSGCETWSLLG